MVSVGYARAYPSGTYIGNVGSGRPTNPRRWYIPTSYKLCLDGQFKVRLDGIRQHMLLDAADVCESVRRLRRQMSGKPSSELLSTIILF